MTTTMTKPHPPQGPSASSGTAGPTQHPSTSHHGHTPTHISGPGARPRKHGARYPWDDWFDLKNFRIVRGKHFYCQLHGMIQAARQAAHKRGFRLEIQVIGESLVIAVCPRN